MKDKIFLHLCQHGRLPFDQKFRNFRNRDKWYKNFLGKVPEDTEIVEFPISEPFNQKFRKFRDKGQIERKFPGKKIRKFGYTSQKKQNDILSAVAMTTALPLVLF